MFKRLATAILNGQGAVVCLYGIQILPILAALANRSRMLPDDLSGYEPHRTLAILDRPTLPNPIVTANELVARRDRHGWSIPSNSPGLSRSGHWLCIACPAE